MKLSNSILGAGALAGLALGASGQTLDLKTVAPIPAKPPRAEQAVDASAAPEAPPAKATSPAVAASFHPLRDGVVYASQADGLWAATARWKARFADDGATFVPFFGSDAPRSAPLALRTVSIEVGGIELSAAAGGVSRDEDRIGIERGQVDEAWQLREESAEQLFVVDEPLIHGDLVVRIAFEGEYEASLDAQGILFTSGLGSVRYGLATAIDAAGRRTSVAEELEDGAIRLTLPGWFLATATYPVTIDPVVTVYGVDSTLIDTIQPDVAFEDATGWYLYVYEHAFSQTDHDVYCILASDAGIVPDSLRGIDSSTVHWTHPRVASNIDGYTFLVVAEVGATGAREVRGRIVDAVSGFPGPEFSITGELGGEQIRPDVGGDPNGALGTSFCVVWQRVLTSTDHDIHARLVDPLTGALSPIILVDNSAATLDEKPAISNSCGSDEGGAPHWTVVWQREYAMQDHDIYGAQVDLSGAIHSFTFPIDESVFDDTNPSVSPLVDGAGTDRPYAVAWERRIAAGNHDVMVAGCVGEQVLGAIDLAVGQPLASNDDLTPQVETDGHLFAVAYTKTIDATDSDVWVNWVYLAGTSLARLGVHEQVANVTLPEAHPALVSKHSGGRDSRRFAVACDVDYGGESDIWGIVLDAPQQVPVESFCTGATDACPCDNSGQHGGCANSATALGSLLTHGGNPNVSDDTLLLTANGLPAGSICMFIQGTAVLNDGAGVPFGDGLRCIGGNVVRLGAVGSFFGVASYPRPGDPSISERGMLLPAGGRRYYQAWYRDSASFCTSDTFNLSNALQVMWLP